MKRGITRFWNGYSATRCEYSRGALQDSIVDPVALSGKYPDDTCMGSGGGFGDDDSKYAWDRNPSAPGFKKMGDFAPSHWLAVVPGLSTALALMSVATTN